MAVQFLGVKNLQVSAKGQRGLAYNQEFSNAVRAQINVVGKYVRVGEVIKAGEATKIARTLETVPASANIKAITATFSVTGGPDEGPALGMGVGVKGGPDGDESFTLDVKVDAPSGLQNIEVKLGNETIWTYAGAAPPRDYEIPDFARQANAYLDSLTPSTDAVTLDFLVTSDIDGRAQISIDQTKIEWSMMQTQAWKNDLDSTVKMDRSLDLGFGEVEVIELDPIPVPAGKRLKRQSVTMDLGGSFGPERLLGRVEAHDGSDFVLVSAANTVAQSLRLDPATVKAPLSCSGVAVYLVPAAPNAPPAELYAELQPDEAGVPASGAPLAKASFTLAPPAEGQQPEWTCATFEAPVELALDTAYWAVVKGVTNVAQVALRPGPSRQEDPVICGEAAIHRGGQTWRPLVARRPDQGPPQALLALLYTPGVETNAAAVEIVVEGAAAGLRIDPAGAVRAISPPVPADERPALRLLARAYAQGALTVANVIQEYRLE